MKMDALEDKTIKLHVTTAESVVRVASETPLNNYLVSAV